MLLLMTLWFSAFGLAAFLKHSANTRNKSCSSKKQKKSFAPLSSKVGNAFFSICVFLPPGCQPSLSISCVAYLTGWSRMHVHSQLLSRADNIHTFPARDINGRRGVWFIASCRTSPFQEENNASSIQPQLQAQISVWSNVGHLKLTLLHAH